MVIQGFLWFGRDWDLEGSWFKSQLWTRKFDWLQESCWDVFMRTAEVPMSKAQNSYML